jgi:starch synthase
MKTGYISYEVAPFAKVGGLADVAGALPKYLKKMSEDIFVVMPYHKVIDSNLSSKIEFVKTELYPISHTFKKAFSVYKTILPNSNVTVYLLKNDDLFYTEEIYSDDVDVSLQSSYFCDCVLTLIKDLEPDTQIINVNDWQTSLIPIYLKINYSDDPILSSMGTVLTIHNLGFQGIFDSSKIEMCGFPAYLYNIDALEFFGNINFLKGGILFSDVINTVSKTYAEEIQTEEFGNKLDGVLRIKSENLYGILNGIDYEIYDPLKNKNLFFPIKNFEYKQKNKIELQKYLNLKEDKNRPVISFIGRLFDQKGVDLIANTIEFALMYDINFVLLGTGDKKYENFFKNLSEKYPDRVFVKIGFDVELAEKIYAGSDIFVMPSKYEPCGLGQMYSMRFGTIPVVRYTGGLEDTVREFYSSSETGTGFGFYDYEDCSFYKALTKSIFYFKNNKSDWEKIFENCIQQDFSYEKTASQYKELYKITYSQIKR